ncbi:hypothetical protein D3C81_1098540 [compost metagenome]
MTWVDWKPSGTASSFCRLRANSAAPVSNTTATATWATTSALLVRVALLPQPVRPPLASSRDQFARRALNTPSNAASTAVSTPASKATTMAVAVSPTGCPRIHSAGTRRPNACSAAHAMASPAALPSNPTSAPSATGGIPSRSGDAPSAVRTALSWVLDSARSSIRLARLIPAIASTQTPAARNIHKASPLRCANTLPSSANAVGGLRCR